jgi:hypothetical protein
MYTLAQHGYTYVSGRTNGLFTADNLANLDFNTEYNGHGDAIYIELSNVDRCKITFDFHYTKKIPTINHTDVPANKLIPMVKKILKEHCL